VLLDETFTGSSVPDFGFMALDTVCLTGASAAPPTSPTALTAPPPTGIHPSGPGRSGYPGRPGGPGHPGRGPFAATGAEGHRDTAAAPPRPPQLTRRAVPLGAGEAC